MMPEICFYYFVKCPNAGLTFCKSPCPDCLQKPNETKNISNEIKFVKEYDCEWIK
jgi:hypothetical protein